MHLNKNDLNSLNDQVIDFNPFVFFPAAIFDLISTCIQYFALNLTYASSFQMLMGILFLSNISGGFFVILKETILNENNFSSRSLKIKVKIE